MSLIARWPCVVQILPLCSVNNMWQMKWTILQQHTPAKASFGLKKEPKNKRRERMTSYKKWRFWNAWAQIRLPVIHVLKGVWYQHDLGFSNVNISMCRLTAQNQFSLMSEKLCLMLKPEPLTRHGVHRLCISNVIFLTCGHCCCLRKKLRATLNTVTIIATDMRTTGGRCVLFSIIKVASWNR